MERRTLYIGGGVAVGTGVLVGGWLLWRRAGLDPNATTTPWSLRLPAGISGREAEVPVGAPRDKTPVGTPNAVVEFRKVAAEKKLAELQGYGLDWSNDDQNGLNPRQIRIRIVQQPNGGAAAWAAAAAAAGWDVGLGNGYLVVQRRSDGKPPPAMPGLPIVYPPEIGGYYDLEPREVLLIHGALAVDADGKVVVETASWAKNKGHPIPVTGPLPALPNGKAPNQYVNPPPPPGQGYNPPRFRMLVDENGKPFNPVSESLAGVRAQLEQATQINWGRLKRTTEAKIQLAHFTDINPEMMDNWRRNDGAQYSSEGMVIIQYNDTGFPMALWWVGLDPPPAWAALPEDQRAEILHSPPDSGLRRVGGIDGNYGIPGYDLLTVPGAHNFASDPAYRFPNLETFGEKFEDPWQRQQETGQVSYTASPGGEMEYLGRVPATARDRIAAIFAKAQNPQYAGRGSPTLEQAQSAFNGAWERFAAEKYADKDKYMSYVVKAAAATGQPYVMAAAAVAAAIVHYIPIQKILFAKEEEETKAHIDAVGFEYTVLLRAAVPFIARVTDVTDVESKYQASVAHDRIKAVRRRQTELPREAIYVMQAYWALAFMAIGEKPNPDAPLPPGVPSVSACFRALGGLNIWTHLANDEQVVLVGLPIALTYKLDPRQFCEALWNRATGWSGWPGLLTVETDTNSNTQHPSNAWSVQWYDLALTAFMLAEGAIKGTEKIDSTL